MGEILTFYSYKGGVGRTLALANIAALLAEWGRRVLCIDWDLEAPGLHLYFSPWLRSPLSPGVVELVQTYERRGACHFKEFVTEVRLPTAALPLHLITAGRRDESYIRRVQELDWVNLYRDQNFGGFLEQLRSDWKSAYDFILIDSRTGVTDIGGICTVHLPDSLVVFSTANHQSLDGVLDVARRAAEQRSRLPFDRGKLLVLPVAARIELRVEYDRAKRWLQQFAESFSPLYAVWAHKDVTSEELLVHTRIPYVPHWSFGENLPVIEEGVSDKDDIGFPLATLAAIIANRFSGSASLVRDRDAFVAAARQPTSLTVAELFYSYSHKDEELRDELENHLSILKRQGVIAGWHDRKIGAGYAWQGEIDAHLNSAAVILLLISADFLASDYCYDIEMKRALERHKTGEARVIPVILRAVDWQGAPFGKLQCLPTDGRPVTSWTNRDEAFRDVVKGIRAALEESLVRKAALTAARAARNVPQARNPNFTGREEMLAELRATLTSGQAAELTQAIHGLGGVGKTQLAIEYAYRHRADYSVVWWVRAGELAALAGDYAALAAALDLPQKDVRDQAVVVEAVRRWLEQNTGWLLVFDNAGEPADIREYLPRSAAGHVIITSRNPAWGTVARPLGIPVFERPTSVEFLLKRTGQADREAAGKLAEALGDLPLALEQAAAYIEATGESLSGHLRMFRERRAELLKRPSPSSDSTVAATWELSFQQVERRSPPAAALLNLCAFLAPDDIPLDIVQQAPELPEPLAEAAADAVQFDDAIAALRRFSLVSRSGDALSVHRLVQAVTRERLAEEARKRWAAAAARSVNRAFPIDSDDVRTWPACSRLLPHALAAADHCEPLAVAPAETARLLNQAGVYLHGRAEFPRARTCFERALKIDEAAHGLDHPNVAACVNNLGLVLQAQGDLAAARACYERALKINEAAYGLDHPNVAACVNNLGLVLQAQGELAGARACFERALKIDEAAYGPDHPKVAIRVNNLGGVLHDQGDLAGARACHERALKIAEAAYGPEHPNVATSVNNLGSVLLDQGDLAGARACFERALKIDEAAYGPEHPKVATDVNNLGRVLQNQGDLGGARACFERALKIAEAALSPDHPNVATRVNNLGGVLQAQGDLAGARACFERALKIAEAAYGPDHPKVATDVNNLGRVLQDQGDLAGARVCFERALGIFRRFLGENHPKTVLVRENLESLGEKGRAEV